jgi:hypothetical protein
MTDSPKTVSDTIASKPADAAVSPPKIPADSDTKPINEPKAPADALPSEPKPVVAPGLLKT